MTETLSRRVETACPDPGTTVTADLDDRDTVPAGPGAGRAVWDSVYTTTKPP